MTSAPDGARILAVDDDSVSRLMIKGALEARGYEVTIVERPSEALELIASGAYTLVISDWNMPEMSGVDLCRAVRNLDLEHYLYFILLTARTGTSEIVEGLAGGADDFMAKPFDPAELEIRVQVGLRTVALDTRDATIFALARLAESRDPETGAHLERVRNYARLLAMTLPKLGHFTDVIDVEYVRLMHATTPLHDIGKVAIPDCVLLKPGRLSDREFEVMKSHTVIGARTIAAVAEKYPWVRFLRVAHDIALCHHERWDGEGYPFRVKGDDIPPIARLFAVIDTFDALTSVRPYREEVGPEAAEHAIVEIKNGIGTHFWPDAAEAFIDLYRRGSLDYILEHFNDADAPDRFTLTTDR